MFVNVSQIFFYIGAFGFRLVVPIIRLLSGLFMSLSTYKLLKARQDKHKFWWLAATWFSPIFTRIAYEIYRRFICKKQTEKVKGSTPWLIASVVAAVLSAVLMAVSLVSVGVGALKSEIDGEFIATFYDVHGNEYGDLYDVPLYDKDGNVYTYKSAWFTVGTFTDQDGNSYDGQLCYLSEDGYLYFDKNSDLKPYEDTLDYYTDGTTVYYDLMDKNVYWERDGTMYWFSGKRHLKLFGEEIE